MTSDPDRAGPRLLVANLDAETRLAGESLTRAALATASALGTLMRAFARPGDALWTPAPVDPERLPELPELPRPELVSGPLEELLQGEKAREGLGSEGRWARVLAWAWTEEVVGRGIPHSFRQEESVGGFGDLLWRGGGPDPRVVEKVLDRRFDLQVARDLGEALPGARWLGSVEELEAHLRQGGAGASPTGGWVVKAPYSAAGRSRYVDKGVAPVRGGLPQAARRRVEGLLARHGELLFEPWMDRLADFGVTGVVLDEGPVALARHQLEVDCGGRFRAIRVGREVSGTGGKVPGTDPGASPGMVEKVPGTRVETVPGTPAGKVPGTGAGSPESEVSGTLVAVAARVGRALAEAGYRGPFGVDSYLHRDAAGEGRLQALAEVNARMTYGHVARALAERFGPGELHVGPSAEGAGERAVQLLTSGDDGSPGAWWIRGMASPRRSPGSLRRREMP